MSPEVSFLKRFVQKDKLGDLDTAGSWRVYIDFIDRVIVSWHSKSIFLTEL